MCECVCVSVDRYVFANLLRGCGRSIRGGNGDTNGAVHGAGVPVDVGGEEVNLLGHQDVAAHLGEERGHLVDDGRSSRSSIGSTTKWMAALVAVVAASHWWGNSRKGAGVAPVHQELRLPRAEGV